MTIQLVAPNGSFYVSPLTNGPYTAASQFSNEDLYWINVVYNAMPSFLRSDKSITQVSGSLDPYVLMEAIGKLISFVSQANKGSELSLYLANTFGSDLDYIGFVRGVKRNTFLSESDDSYRSRIQLFWSPPDSTLLEKSLNSSFGQYGVFKVFEVPYTFFSLDNTNAGGFLGRNSIVLPESNFSVATRTMNDAIVIYLKVPAGTTPPTQTVVNNQIYPLVNNIKPYGVSPFIVVFS